MRLPPNKMITNYAIFVLFGMMCAYSNFVMPLFDSCIIHEIDVCVRMYKLDLYVYYVCMYIRVQTCILF